LKISKAGAAHRNISNYNDIPKKLRCAAPKGCGILDVSTTGLGRVIHAKQFK